MLQTWGMWLYFKKVMKGKAMDRIFDSVGGDLNIGDRVYVDYHDGTSLSGTVSGFMTMGQLGIYLMGIEGEDSFDVVQTSMEEGGVYWHTCHGDEIKVKKICRTNMEGVMVININELKTKLR